VRKALVVVGAVVALIGIGAAAIPFAEDVAARRLKEGLAREGVQAETVKVSFLDRSIRLSGVAGGPNAELAIADWEASGLAWPLDELLKGRVPFAGLSWGDPLHVARLHMRNFRLAQPDVGGSWTIGELTATGVDLPRYDAVYEGPHRSEAMIARLLGALTVGRLEQGTVAHQSFDGTVYSAATIVLDGYEHGLMKTLEVNGFETRVANARAATLSVAEVAAAGVDLRRPIRIASSLDWEPGTPIGRVPVAKARLSGFGGDLLGRYGVSLGSVASETTRESADVSRSRTTVEGFVLAPSLRSVEALAQRADAVIGRADERLLGPGGLTQDAQGAVRELQGALADARGTLRRLDGVLQEAQAIGSNVRGATTDLGSLRADVEASLRKVESLINDVQRRWPFARDAEVKLP